MNSIQNKITLNPSTWVDDHADYLYAFAIERINDRNTTEDLIQDTFLSALQAIEKFQQKSTVRTWLTSILKNKIYDHYKKTKKNELNLVSEVEFTDSYFKPGGYGKVWINKIEEQWDFDSAEENSTKFRKMLHNCIDQLSSFQQSVFKLKNLEGMDAQEICKVLDLSESNYWVITHRSKVKLKKCVEINWFNKVKN
jgi:RNA polymerase sigma-70 factor (ECF subfamily)